MKRFATRSEWRPSDWCAAAFVLMLVLLQVASAIGPWLGRVEGEVAPVAVGFEIGRSAAVSIGETRIWGSLEVVRACRFMAVEWELVDPVRRFPVDVIFEAGSRARPGGVSDFGPWRLSIAHHRLGATEAFAYHDCGGLRWWLTKTPLFSGAANQG